MQLAQLEYFVAVAREQHFGRAAAACYISPSALSEAIHKLELELGVPLVRRGRAFEGLTAEGELALVWARRVLADDRALRDEIGLARERLAAEVRFGVIPSAVPRAASVLTALSVRHPHVRARMVTGLTTEEIVAGLRHYELDAGLIHPSIDDTDGLLVTPLYEEAFVVVCSRRLLPDSADAITGRTLVELPLCLLEPHMRARRILDTAFEEQGLSLEPRIETNSVEGLLALVRAGEWASVVPRSTPRLDGSGDLRTIELTEPAVSIPIALARLAEDPRSPLAAAFDDIAHG